MYYIKDSAFLARFLMSRKVFFFLSMIFLFVFPSMQFLPYFFVTIISTIHVKIILIVLIPQSYLNSFVMYLLTCSMNHNFVEVKNDEALVFLTGSRIASASCRL